MNAALDIAQARFNMIEQQIRPWDVLDQDVLNLLEVVRREEFVPPALRHFAFTDTEIPLRTVGGGGARMWVPRLEARVLLSSRRGTMSARSKWAPGAVISLLSSRAAARR